MSQTNIQFLNKIREYFEFLPFNIKGKNLCVCLSGGADSVALLRAMNILAEELQINLNACHFNHMIRGDEADGDENFCRNLCESLNIKIYCGRDDVPAFAKVHKLSLEEAARKCRYAFFERISAKYNIDFCLTAHNMNDDAETLLFNLIRGSGSNGATSISKHNDTILRPLLKITREEIEQFLADLSQDFVTDSTNESVEYTRNFIRHIIMPEVKKINPNAVRSLSRFADSCRNDREYFDAIVDNNLDADLSELPKSLRHRIYIKKFKDFSSQSLNFDTIQVIDKLVMSRKRSIIPVYMEYEAVISNGNVEFFLKNNEFEYSFDEIDLDFGNNSVFNGRVEISISNNSFDESENFNKISISEKLSSANIVGSLKVRNRKVGDKICIFGINKCLKKLFIEKKVPKEYRNAIPVISDDEGILYVPFVGVADRAFLKNADNAIYLKIVFNSIEKERWINAYEK